MSAEALRIEMDVADAVPVLTLAGELRLPEAATLLGVLAGTVESSPTGTAVCDVARLAVPDREALLSVFPAALRRAGGWPRRAVRLAAPGPALLRALWRSRIPRYLPVDPSVTAAIAAAADERPGRCHEVRLAPTPRSVRIARDLVDDVVRERTGALLRGRTEALLVTNELATNAVRHVAEPFTLSLSVARDRVTVAVTDPSRAEPVLQVAAPVEDGGRGLRLVQRLSREWGVRLVHGGGKCVWASVDAEAARIPRCRRGD